MNYDKYRKIAENKIKQYGGKCFIIRKGADEVYNPTTCQYESTEEIIEGSAVMSTFDVSQVNGTSILSGDVKLMCTFPKEPLITDKVTFGSKTYTIVSIQPMNPNGSCTIIYDIQAR